MSTEQFEACAKEELCPEVVVARRITSVGVPCMIEQSWRDRECFVQLWYNGNDVYEVRWCRPAGVDETCPSPQYGSRSFALSDLVKANFTDACFNEAVRDRYNSGDEETLAEWNIECAIDQYYTFCTELGL